MEIQKNKNSGWERFLSRPLEIRRIYYNDDQFSNFTFSPKRQIEMDCSHAATIGE